MLCCCAELSLFYLFSFFLYLYYYYYYYYLFYLRGAKIWILNFVNSWGEGFLFIVVGQPLWFRLHVRCSFYHSIHKDNGGRGGTQSQVKKIWETWKGKIIKWVPSHSSNHFICLWPFAFCSAPLLGDFGIPLLAFAFGPLSSVSLFSSFFFC